MKNITITLEQAKELHKKGLQNQSVFNWVSDSDAPEHWELAYKDGYNWDEYPCYRGYKNQLPAYTFEELSLAVNYIHPVVSIEASGIVSVEILANEILNNWDRIEWTINLQPNN